MLADRRRDVLAARNVRPLRWEWQLAAEHALRLVLPQIVTQREAEREDRQYDSKNENAEASAKR